jgi:SAM-dependent methyltransferase
MMDILACPVCGRSFDLSISGLEEAGCSEDSFPECSHYCAYISRDLTSSTNRKEAYAHCRQCYQEDVAAGALTCPKGHTYPIRGSIPRFVSTSAKNGRTKQTFDVEWGIFQYEEKIYGHTRDEELGDFFRRMVVDEAFLRDKTILDAGCGVGRLAQSINRLAREVVAIDLSGGVEEARIRNRDKGTVHVIQGDIMALPLGTCSFEYAYAKGVLHYVSDPRKCVSGLAKVVRPGGELSITIYPRMSPLFETFNRQLRRITLKLPVSIVFRLSFLLLPFFSLSWKWSGVEQRPIEWNERAHMIFNWLSSAHQNRATNEEAVGWFREYGFEQMKLSDIPVGITGTKCMLP